LEVANGTKGNLYYCDGSTSCTPVASADIGYYRNKGDGDNGTVPYIKCTASNNCVALAVTNVGASGHCKSTTDKESNAITPALDDGDIIYNDTDYILCVSKEDNQNGVVLDTTVAKNSAVSYFITVGNSNVFGDKSSKYVAIDLYKGHALRQQSGNYHYNNIN